MSVFTYIYISLMITIIPVKSVHDVHVIVPPKVLAGSTVTLFCIFDLHGAPLYTVKWYRGSYEFYRYVPRERNPATAFPVQGLDIDISGSNANTVTLRAVPKSLSGRFTCEVSADAPSFSTNTASANMTITDMLVRKPLLTPDSSVHYVGTPLHVNCSAQSTDPAPQISFYIDNDKIGNELVQNVSPGIAVLSAQNMSKEPGLRWLRCEATVPGVYHLISASVPILQKHATGKRIARSIRNGNVFTRQTAINLIGPLLDGTSSSFKIVAAWVEIITTICKLIAPLLF